MNPELRARLERALREYRGKPLVVQNFGELPAGVSGIARVVECRIGKYARGEYAGEHFWVAAAIVVEPKFFNGNLIAGMRTTIIEPLCDTPNRSRQSLEEHVAFVLNELKKMGVDVTHVDTLEDLQAICDAVNNMPSLYIRFMTRAVGDGYVHHIWCGLVNYQEETANEVDSMDDGDNDSEPPTTGGQSTVEKPEIDRPTVDGPIVNNDQPPTTINQPKPSEPPTRLELPDGTLIDRVIREGMTVKIHHEGMILEGVVVRSYPRRRIATIELTDGTRLANVSWDRLF